MKKILFILLAVTSTGFAQKKKTSVPIVKQALSPSVYDGWKDISLKAITPDGKFASVLINPQDGDGRAVFVNLKSSTEDSIQRASDLQLTFDSKFAVFKIKPQKEIIKELRRQKKKKEDLPKDSLGIYSFNTRKTEKIADVKSYKIPEKAHTWLAFQLEAKKETKKTVLDKKDSTKKNEPPLKTKAAKKNTDDNGYTLVLKNLITGKETYFAFVKDYLFAKY